MLNGITDLELLPSHITSLAIADQVYSLFSRAQNIKASIAFWTLSPESLDKMTDGHGIRVLRDRGSFLCVDIQRPTNIDHLANLCRQGVTIYLNIKRLSQKVDRLKISTSRGLLHTKVLVSDLEEDNAEIWIGSHNWTIPALIGPNTELSISFKLYQQAPLYNEIYQRLQDIKKNSHLFDLDKVNYYKELQAAYTRDTESKIVIELEGHDVANLGGEVICVFGSERIDFNSVSSVNKEVCLSVYESDGGEKYLYQAKVLQTGLLETANPKAEGLSLSKRRFAFTVGRSFPYLEEEKMPNPSIFEHAYFFANIEVLSFETSEYQLHAKPEFSRRSRWAKYKYDSALERINDNQVNLYYKNIDPSELVEIPSDDDRVAGDYEQGHYIDFSEKSLLERRKDRDYRLIRKRIITYKK